MKNKLTFTFIVILSVLFTSARANDVPDPAFESLIKRLLEEGHDSQVISHYFKDERVRFKDLLVPVNMVPSDKKDVYAGFLSKEQIIDGLEFLSRWKQDLLMLLKNTAISPEYAVAILKIESNLGRRSGSHQVFSTFATISSINNPVYWEHFSDTSNTLTVTALSKRAERRSKWAYKELITFLEVCKVYDWDPLEIEGSWAGAFGSAQFLPSSYARCARDGNEDGLIQPNNLHDAVASLACYLKEANWSTSYKSKRRALYLYNPSNAYVECILEYANRLKSYEENQHHSSP